MPEAFLPFPKRTAPLTQGKKLELESYADIERAEAAFEVKHTNVLFSSGRRRCCIRRRTSARRGAPVPTIGTDSDQTRVRRRFVKALFCLCLIGKVIDLALAFQTGVARSPLCPARALVYIGHVTVIAAPAISLATLHAWRQLDLPGRDGVSGQRFVQALWWAFWASLTLLACHCLGGNSVKRLALLAYAPMGAAAWVFRGDARSGVQRFLQTWAVFLPLAFEYKVLHHWTMHARIGAAQQAQAYARLHAKYARRVYQLVVEQGGAFVKIGHLLSLLPKGVIPEQFMNELRKLQCTVPHRSVEEIRGLVEGALGCEVEDIFSDFDDTPIGSASIGQVYRARLRSDGRLVAVKVQHPEVSRTLKSDFTNCERLVWLLDKSRVGQVQEIRKQYVAELDFELEAEMMERISANLRKEFPHVRVPQPLHEFSCRTVLTMTFIPGTSLLDSFMVVAEVIAKARGKTVEELMAELSSSTITDSSDFDDVVTLGDGASTEIGEPGWYSALANIIPGFSASAKLKMLQSWLMASSSARNVGVTLYNQSLGRLAGAKLQYHQPLPSYDPVELSSAIWRVHGHQLLNDGLFNADPHPGNVLVGCGPSMLGLVDFGQVSQICSNTRVHLASLLLALATGDDTSVAQWHARLGMRTKYMSKELLALSARIKFGDVAVLSTSTFEKYKALAAKDPILPFAGEEGLCRAERLINLLRGTSFIIGAPPWHGPTTLWTGMARNVLESRCASVSTGDNWP